MSPCRWWPIFQQATITLGTGIFTDAHDIYGRSQAGAICTRRLGIAAVSIREMTMVTSCMTCMSIRSKGCGRC